MTKYLQLTSAATKLPSNVYGAAQCERCGTSLLEILSDKVLVQVQIQQMRHMN